MYNIFDELAKYMKEYDNKEEQEPKTTEEFLNRREEKYPRFFED